MLSDGQKRAAYDQYGHAGVDPNMRGGPGAEGFGGFAEAFGDIFGDVFGGARGGAPGRRAPGVPRQRPELRDGSHARGSGRRQGRADPHPELGRLRHLQGHAAPSPAPSRSPAPPATARARCRCARASSACSRPARPATASGKIIPEPCTTCHGQGKIKNNKTLEVKIPAGIDDGMRIRSTGNGEPGTNGGPPGDLYIEIRLKKHEVFERDGDDLHCVVPVSITTAALGGEIDVPTLKGAAAIDIPDGTQSGKQFRLRGKGIKGVRSSYPGDLYCHVRVETPVKLTEHQRKLLKELDESLKKGGDKHSPTDKGWFDKAKEFFS